MCKAVTNRAVPGRSNNNLQTISHAIAPGCIPGTPLKKVPEDRFVGFAYGGDLSGETAAAPGEGHRVPGGTVDFQHGEGCVNFLHGIVVGKSAPEMGARLPVFLRLPE